MKQEWLQARCALRCAEQKLALNAERAHSCTSCTSRWTENPAPYKIPVLQGGGRASPKRQIRQELVELMSRVVIRDIQSAILGALHAWYCGVLTSGRSMMAFAVFHDRAHREPLSHEHGSR